MVRERNGKMNECVDGQWIDEEREILCSCICVLTNSSCINIGLPLRSGLSASLRHSITNLTSLSTRGRCLVNQSPEMFQVITSRTRTGNKQLWYPVTLNSKHYYLKQC